ncbi:MAG: ArdC family protein [Spirochaetaceae bacterium]|jgi:hypothetical protein|nr:ArdC family protein [Spirochaetaceae bacterium]
MSDSFMPDSSLREQIPLPADFSGVSQNDLAIISAKHDRKQFIAALDTGALSCLPGKNGLADTQPARNAVNRTTYRGSSQLLLKIFQKQNGFPTAKYCTFDQVQKAAAFTGQRSYLKKGSKGITLNFQINGEQKSVRLFNITQVNNPEVVHAYAEHLSQNREEYFKQKYGDRYRPGEKQAKGPAIICSSSDPDVYLGQYLTAISLERPFRASPQQAAEFAQNTKDFIFERNEAGHINPFNLNRLGSKASNYCKQMIPKVMKQQRETNRQKPPSQIVAELSIGY